MGKKISISQLGALLICEYKIYLKYVIKVKEKLTKSLIKGQKAHEKLDKKHKNTIKNYNNKVINIKNSNKTDSQKKKEIAKIEKPEELKSKREFSVKGLRLIGRIDEIQFNEDDITIIDDKKHTSVFDSDKVQVLAYIMAYKENFSDEVDKKYPEGVKFIGKVRSYTTGDIIWEREYDDDCVTFINQTIKRYDDVVSDRVTPTSTTIPAVCRGCSVRNMCDRKLKTTSVEEFLSN